MNQELLHCLTGLSEEVRLQISLCHQRQDTDPSSMAEWLTHPSLIAESRRHLSKNEQYAIDWFLWESKGGILWDREDSTVDWGKMRPGLVKLAQKGWVYALRNERHERFFYCPREVRAAWIRENGSAVDGAFSASLRLKGNMRPLGQPTVGMGQALFHFLVSLDAEPWILSKTGRLPKRQARKLDIELDLPVDSLTHTKWGREEEIPPWVSLLFEIATRYGLIRITEERIGICPDVFARWLKKDWGEMVTNLYQTVRSLWSEHHPGVDGNWLLLETCVGRDWVSFTDLTRLKSALIGRKLRKKEIEAFIWLTDALGAMGWLEMGEWEGGERGIRWSHGSPFGDRNASVPPLYIQNTMDLFVPAAFPLAERYRLAQMADFMGGDQLLVYAITPQSLRRAKRYGHTLEDVIRFLRDQSGGKLPDWVNKRLRHDWNQDDSFLLEKMVVIHAPSKEAMKEFVSVLGHCPQTRQFTETCWGIPLQFFDDVKEKLRERKFEIGQLPVTERPVEAISVEDGFSLLALSKVEDRLPSAEDWFPFTKTLPSPWLSGMRSYQPDMLKEMVRQSVRYRLRLVVEQEGRRFQVDPLSLNRRGGEWVIEARKDHKKMVLPLDRIDRIKIQNPFVSETD